MWLTLSGILALLLDCLIVHAEKIPFKNVLEDLQASYWNAYPEKLIRPYGENLTIRPNLNLRKIHLESDIRCEELSVLSLEQFQKLKENLGEDALLKEIIGEMTYQPRARLYSGEWYDGKYLAEYYYSGGAGLGGCYNFKSPKPFNKEIQTWGKCVRLFRLGDCQGHTLAVYPGSRIPNGRLKELKFIEIKSIGPCLSNEFHSSSFKNANEMEIQKNPQFKSYNPDLFELSLLSEANYGMVKALPKGGPLGIYSLGPKDRLEILQAFITKKNVDISQENLSWENITKDIPGMEGNDVFIYAIPPILGGAKNESINLFLGSPSSGESWGEVSSQFASLPTLDQFLQIWLIFVYEGSGTRPLYFYYRAEAPGIVSYGRILNEQKMLERNSSDIFENPIGNVSPPSVSLGNRLGKILEKIREGRKYSSPWNVNRKHEKSNLNLCKFLTQYQNAAFPNSNGSEKLETELGALRRMDLNPLVRLYYGENHTGGFEEFSFLNEREHWGICYDRSSWVIKKKIRSVAVFGSCVRIFTLGQCRGNSFPIYSQHSYGAGFETLLTLSGNLSLIKSLGPCLPEESVDSFLKNSKKLNPLQLSFTEQIEFFSESKRENSTSLSESGSILKLARGRANRTEFLEGFLEPENYLDMNKVFHEQNNNNISRGFFKTREGKIFAYAIPSFLNGPINETYNTFETSEEALKDWMSVLFNIGVMRNRYAALSLNFIYENDTSTRPIWLNYYFKDQLRGISYGRLWNGQRGDFKNYSRYENWITKMQGV